MSKRYSEPLGFDILGGSSRMVTVICDSFCDGFCGMSYDEDDEDSRPSSMDDNELCLDDGEDKGCNEFYSENE